VWITGQEQNSAPCSRCYKSAIQRFDWVPVAVRKDSVLNPPKLDVKWDLSRWIMLWRVNHFRALN
jgi:hypothetical protein